MPAKAVIQFRRDTESNWDTANPVLAAGEVGYVTSGTNAAKFKIGNGSSTWSALPFFSSQIDLYLIGEGLELDTGTTPDTLNVTFGTTAGTVLEGDHATTTSGVHGVTGDVVGTTDVQNLSNKAFINFREKFNVTGAAATGDLNIDAATAALWYYNVNSTGDYTLNFRNNSGSTLSSILSVGDAMTIAVFVKHGSTAYAPTAYKVDGVEVTPIWQVSAPPEAGDANSTNCYSFTILKTSSDPTYTVFASQTRFD